MSLHESKETISPWAFDASSSIEDDEARQLRLSKMSSQLDYRYIFLKDLRRELDDPTRDPATVLSSIWSVLDDLRILEPAVEAGLAYTFHIPFETPEALEG